MANLKSEMSYQTKAKQVYVVYDLVLRHRAIMHVEYKLLDKEFERRLPVDTVLLEG